MNMLAQIQNDNNTDQVTMTSLEIVDFINSQRNDDDAVLRHSDFLAKVTKVIGFEYSEKFRSTYTAENGKENPCYRFPKREACLMAMSYSYELQAKIYDRMTAMESALMGTPSYMIDDPIARAEEWIREQKEKQIAVKQLELQAPKVEYYDKVVERSTLLNASQVAQKLKMSAVKMNKLLDAFNVYHHGVKRARLFQQWFIDKGLGEVKQTELGFSQPMFTTKGEAWVIEKLVSEGVA